MTVNTATIPYTVGLQDKNISCVGKRLSRRDRMIVSELNRRIEREKSGEMKYYSLEESRRLLRRSEQQWMNIK